MRSHHWRPTMMCSEGPGSLVRLDKLLAERGDAADKEYRVRWAGWGSEYDSCESVDHIYHSSLIHEVEAEKLQRC